MNQSNLPANENPSSIDSKPSVASLEENPLQNSVPKRPIKREQVQFTGKGGEYFRIWVVNILLSILTLGIYSAWAKVRTNQYFYANTHIGGHTFRYLATPMQILKGRIVAAGIFIGITVASSFFPIVGIISAVLFLLLFPWLLIQGLRFNLRHTSFRNVRFGFHASYGKTLLNFILLPIIGVLTLYLAFPWVMKRIDKYIHENISYGDQSFEVNTSTSTYYGAGFAAFGMSILLGILGAIVTAIVSIEPSTLSQSTQIAGFDLGATLSTAVTMIAYWLSLTIIGATYRAIIRNHLMESLTLENVASFQSEVEIGALVWINFTNALLIILTLGLALPYTKIRKTRYLADVTTVIPEAGASEVLDNLSQESSAFGEEAAGIYDVDFALG